MPTSECVLGKETVATVSSAEGLQRNPEDAAS